RPLAENPPRPARPATGPRRPGGPRAAGRSLEQLHRGRRQRWRAHRDVLRDGVDALRRHEGARRPRGREDGVPRAPRAAAGDRIVGGIVDHGYVLQDIDGRATRWGNWSPESLNGDPNWYEERAGNSVEILSFLGVAYHMTGKAKYQDAARYLIGKHGYARNM